MTIIKQKQNLRLALRHKRQSYSYRQEASLKISENLQAFLKSKQLNPPVLGLYHPMGSEASLMAFAQNHQNIYSFALPKISPEGMMYFSPWNWGAPLYKDDLSIFVPYGTAMVIPDVICVPLLGFTAQKYRLGQGGGYYDKYIHKHKENNILWLGVAFECQKLLDMPLEEHDEKLDFIITEKQIY